jgi:hypothetical protein
MARRSSEAAPADFNASVAECAYFKAERRGFAPGHELEDWLAAEREIAASAALTTVAAPSNGSAKRKTARIKKLK